MPDGRASRARRRYACVFPVEPEVTDRIHERYIGRWDSRQTPVGAFIRLWRREHCATLNPYTSADCPYSRAACTKAYEDAASDAILGARARTTVPGLFSRIARVRAAERADAKPLSRERQGHPRTGREGLAEGPDVGGQPSASGLSGQAVGRCDGLDQDVQLRRSLSRPVRIGDMFRKSDPRPREGSAKDGQASSVRSGTSGDDL
jgi:hypothetical protein